MTGIKLNLSFIGYLLPLSCLSFYVTSQEVKEYCPSESFEPMCHEGEVIFMTLAHYGRMRTGKCITNAYDKGCEKDVLGFFHDRCSGRQKCSVYVSDRELHQVNPCSKDLSSYLEAAYECVPVASATLEECHNDMQHGKVLDGTKRGYISSDTTVRKHPIGTAACPWIIRVQEGRRIKLTLHSFGKGKMTTWEGSGPLGKDISESSKGCPEYGVVKEEGYPKFSLTPCGVANSRSAEVYKSQTNELEVVLRDGNALGDLWPFLIEYEAIGCPKIEPRAGRRVENDGDRAVVRCNSSEEIWYLTCADEVWVGDLGNCTNIKSLQTTSSPDMFGGFPIGILLIVALGVALGVFLGGILLTFVAIRMKKKQRGYHEGQCDDIYQSYQSRNDQKSKLNPSAQPYYDVNHFSSHDYGIQPDCPAHGHNVMTTSTLSNVTQSDIPHQSDHATNGDGQPHDQHLHSIVHTHYGTNGRPLSHHTHLYEKTCQQPVPRCGT